MSSPDLSRRARPVHAAVVGSGFGGLAAAIRLQTAGVRTTLYEALDKPGGRAYVYEDQGFTFDAGPTVITAPECLEELFTLSGREMRDYVELMPIEPFYRLAWDDGSTFDYTNDDDALRAQIHAMNPADVAGYERFLKYSKDVFDEGYGKLVHTPFMRFWDMIKVAPKLIKLGAQRSVYGAVSRFIENEHLREALSFHSLLIGGSPFETSAIYTLIHHLERTWGVHFPRGGTGALVQALVRLFEELGGELRLSSPVDRLEPAGEGGRVHALGEARDFDLVVSNADVHHTYERLLDGAPGAAKQAKKLAKKDWSMSLFVLYFGTDRLYRDRLAHHTILFGPRYKGLIDEIFHGHTLPEDFSLYLHAPTVTDPSLAPPGCDSFYVLSPVPNLGQADLDWDAIAPEYAERILAALETHMPDLRQHVVTKRWTTPFTFRDELRSHLGAAFSLAPTLTQSAWFRPHNRDAKHPWLYFAGAGTHPGAGVPGVINSAKATAGLVLEDLASGRLARDLGAPTGIAEVTA
ncbi:MAG: phytoene desaturase [Deltaproteobacteria bacterium HGW-Deltaproteobacteria-14]|jgi:phytoene desaturase|nr:MAG: phytoene desaturase [Deltaproteobacteria bacterium HGW-Deltaproteobacteria-14]